MRPRSRKSDSSAPCEEAKQACKRSLPRSRMVPITDKRRSTPAPVNAEIGQTPSTAPLLNRCIGSELTTSILFGTSKTGISPAPISSNTPSITRICSSKSGLARSTRWRSKSALLTSSSVLLKASIRECGILLMNPTVSMSMTLSPFGRRSARVVGSKVAKSLFSTNTPARVSVFIKVDLPAFVYPTKATIVNGTSSRSLRCNARVRSTVFNRRFRWLIRSRILRRSTSNWVSPGPRVPMPPPSRDKCVHWRVNRGKRYSSCASSTCSFPSLLRARWAKISRIN